MSNYVFPPTKEGLFRKEHGQRLKLEVHITGERYFAQMMLVFDELGRVAVCERTTDMPSPGQTVLSDADMPQASWTWLHVADWLNEWKGLAAVSVRRWRKGFSRGWQDAHAGGAGLNAVRWSVPGMTGKGPMAALKAERTRRKRLKLLAALDVTLSVAQEHGGDGPSKHAYGQR